jgi:uncharacterized protein (DUF3084 family)
LQLQAKDEEIEQLQIELSAKEDDIAELEDNLQSMLQQNSQNQLKVFL